MDMKRMDVSRFMLFEATGDSEADGDADIIMDEQFAGAVGEEEDDDDDDAQSCCHEGSESHNWDLGDQHLSGHTSRFADAEYEHQHRDTQETDGEETGVYGTSYCDDDEIQKHQHRSSLSVDSGQQFMDEVEKNRRFWEACLAS